MTLSRATKSVSTKVFLMALAGCCLLMFCPVDTPAFARGSSRGAMRRVRRMMAAKKKQTVSKLQSNLTSAQKVLTQAQSQLTTASSALQSAKSQQTTARERVDAMEKEVHDAQIKLKEYEAQLIASQGPETPLGKAKAQLEAAQIALDKTVHAILSLPNHDHPTDEAERSKERLLLSGAQKSRLHSDAKYKKAEEDMHSASSVVSDAQRQLFESDRGWQTAHSTWQAAHDDLKTLKHNATAAGAEVSRNARQVKAASAQVMQAQQIILSSQRQLLSMGVKPQASK